MAYRNAVGGNWKMKWVVNNDHMGAKQSLFNTNTYATS
jgi:hypothetical protein